MVTTDNAILLMFITASGFCDIKERKIPNKITFTGVLIGIFFNIITGGWTGLLQGSSDCLPVLRFFSSHLRWAGWVLVTSN